jgi:chemotaxis signal transduction protein
MHRARPPKPTDPATPATPPAIRTVGGRERYRTPRDLAAVLNPGRERTVRALAIPPRPAAQPKPTPPAPVAAPAAAPFRERVAARAGHAELLVFRVGRELFATELRAVEEAVEAPTVHAIPDASADTLGVFALRERTIPVYAPQRALGVALIGPQYSTLIVRSGTQRIALAVDALDDVFDADLAGVRVAPGTDDPDGVLLGIVWRGKDLVAVVDADALVAACPSAATPAVA